MVTKVCECKGPHSSLLVTLVLIQCKLGCNIGVILLFVGQVSDDRFEIVWEL